MLPDTALGGRHSEFVGLNRSVRAQLVDGVRTQVSRPPRRGPSERVSREAVMGVCSRNAGELGCSCRVESHQNASRTRQRDARADRTRSRTFNPLLRPRVLTSEQGPTPRHAICDKLSPPTSATVPSASPALAVEGRSDGTPSNCASPQDVGGASVHDVGKYCLPRQTP